MQRLTVTALLLWHILLMRLILHMSHEFFVGSVSETSWHFHLTHIACVTTAAINTIQGHYTSRGAEVRFICAYPCFSLLCLRGPYTSGSAARVVLP